ncbi:hypothetical protein CEXT_134991 [Caerostris extrusa]|uniref:Uncharacterized protein n=1 Tax=Caerostris extrusa TaxID=172846 RepID=A0AAV4W2Z3_CAEEX|nr:hypothetical protein CEXT_134991 [Caerostris extrusa]
MEFYHVPYLKMAGGLSAFIKTWSSSQIWEKLYSSFVVGFLFRTSVCYGFTALLGMVNVAFGNEKLTFGELKWKTRYSVLSKGKIDTNIAS